MKTFTINLQSQLDRQHLVYTAEGFKPATECNAIEYTDEPSARAAFYKIGRDDFMRLWQKGCHNLTLWLTEIDNAVVTVLIQNNLYFQNDCG